MDVIRGLLHGELALSSRMEEVLSSCLLCMACQFSCPPGVTAQKVILEARHRAVSQKGLPLLKRLAFRRLLPDRKALSKALRAASALQRRRSNPSHLEELRPLPSLLGALSGGRALPPIAQRALSQRIPARIPPSEKAQRRGSVAIFSGCYLEFVDTPVAEAAVGVLTSLGYEVLLPRDQVCCGAPVLYSGDLEGALPLAKLNAKAFARHGVDTVLTLCATCGSALKEGYGILLPHLEGRELEEVEALRGSVEDLGRFLASTELWQGQPRRTELKVTYHDPCHHVRGMGIQSEPRSLIQGLPGVELVEMTEPARCCGGGGTFSLTHPRISLEIGRWKIEDIRATGASAVVTSCPGCILQIREVALREGLQVEVLHLAQLLERSLIRPFR
jgi:glycolate oxidase iron-sulfur subunit